MDLKNLYSQIIIENSRNSQHRHELDDATATERGHNPSCGDDISLSIKVEEGVIEEAAFTGTGCAISQASTSLMCDLIEGETLAVAKEKIETFLGMIKGEIKDDEVLEDELGDAIALKSISVMPQRVKCAVLAWHTLDHMIADLQKAE